MDKIRIEYLPIEQVKRLKSKNPNIMPPAEFDALKKSIKQNGFLQPILAAYRNNEVVLVDGENRIKAMTALGETTIPAVVAADETQAEILRISMNRIRGEMDLSQIAQQFDMLLDAGFTKEDLELTGYTDYEIDTLLDSLSDEDLEDELELDESAAEPAKPKTYNLTIKYDSESERAHVKEALERLGDGDVREGIHELIRDAGLDNC